MGKGRAEARARWNFGIIIAIAATGIFAALVVLAFIGIYWSTHQSDRVSVNRQIRMAQLAIELGLDELALQQETVAIWDETAERLARRNPDRAWLFDNIGSWLHRIFRHDETYILDARDEPVQSTLDGKLAPTHAFERRRDDLQYLIDAVRGRIHGPNGKHDRNPGRTPHEQTSVQTTARSTHDTHLMLVGGRPAAASAMLVRPSTPGRVRQPGGPPVLVSVRYLDRDFLSALSAKHLISAPRFSRTLDAAPEEQALVLRTEWGTTIGYLIWHPELPGTAILRKLAPLNGFVLLALGAFIAALAYRLSRSLSALDATQMESAHRAFHDALTGLPNRALLKSRIDRVLADEGGSAAWLIMIDIDRFKEVNDTLGHLAGDQLICQFGERLASIVPEEATLARLGGDEFAVLLPGGLASIEVERICSEILELFERPFLLAETQIYGSASLGLARGTGLTEQTELFRRADVALYCAKEDGRNCWRTYTSAMDERTQSRAQLHAELRQAIEEGELAVWYQPKVSRGRALTGFEALLRWHHPVHGIVAPGDIIPVAEETGLILAIGDHVLRSVAQTAVSWPNASFAINLSPVQLRTNGFVEHVLAIFAQAGADPERIELEVTERVLLDDNQAVQKTLSQLRKVGFRVALDDFGTGYSSLGYLQRFQVDKIKIDRSFVADVLVSAQSCAIVSAIVALGHALDLTVTAEGVETQEQADMLLAAGCDELQGHLFGKAWSIEELRAYMEANRETAIPMLTADRG